MDHEWKRREEISKSGHFGRDKTVHVPKHIGVVLHILVTDSPLYLKL